MITNKIDRNQRIEFVLSSDKSEPKTVFVLRPLRSTEIINLPGKTKEEKAISLMTESIVEVRNFGDYENILEVIDSLVVDDVKELSSKIGELCHINMETEKNS